jgi:hypothetical protein
MRSWRSTSACCALISATVLRVATAQCAKSDNHADCSALKDFGASLAAHHAQLPSRHARVSPFLVARARTLPSATPSYEPQLQALEEGGWMDVFRFRLHVVRGQMLKGARDRAEPGFERAQGRMACFYWRPVTAHISHARWYATRVIRRLRRHGFWLQRLPGVILGPCAPVDVYGRECVPRRHPR